MFKRMLEVGSRVFVGGKEVEVESILSKEDYLAGRPFLRSAKAAPAETLTAVAPGNFFGKQFKTPLLSSTVLANTNSATPTPRHNPKAEGALVMPRPSAKGLARCVVLSLRAFWELWADCVDLGAGSQRQGDCGRRRGSFYFAPSPTSPEGRCDFLVRSCHGVEAF